MIRYRTRVAAAIAASMLSIPALVLTAPGASAGVATADQTSTSATSAKGKVIANGGLHVRALRTTASKVVGTLAEGKVVALSCKAKGEPIGGNKLWYRLGANRWVTARYVANVGPAPEVCDGAEAAGKVLAKPSLTERAKPTTASAREGRLKYGKTIEIICKVNGQRVDGNPRWYQLFDGHWVAARYVANIGYAPDPCR